VCAKANAIWQPISAMMLNPINEIFYSLQGEGFHVGRPAVFVRFSGCNLRCPFCDTDYRAFTMMSDEDIVREASAFPSHFVVLTGGEPSLFVTDDLVAKLHDAGFYVAVETNGTHALPTHDTIDWVTLSPKDAFCPHAHVVLTKVDEVKVVFANGNPEAYLRIPAAHYFLQPCDVGDAERNAENVKACVAYCKAHPQWRLSLQVHKLLGIR